MNKTSRFIFGVIVTVCLLVIFVISMTNNNKSQKVVDEIVKNVLKSEDNILLFVGASECEKCMYEAKEFALLHEMYDLAYYYMDLDDIKVTSKKNKILTDLGFDLNAGVQLPSLAVYKDGKMIDSLAGVRGLDTLTKFLSENNVLESNELPVKFHDIVSYNSMMEKKEKKVFLVSTYNNAEAISFQNIIIGLAKKNGFEVNMLYLDDITQDEYDIIYNSNKFFRDYVVDVTTLVIFDENNNVLAHSLKKMTEEEYIEIFKNASIINN